MMVLLQGWFIAVGDDVENYILFVTSE